MKRLPLFLLIFSMDVMADATACYAPSPNATLLGEAYYALDREIKLDSASASSLQTLLQSLQGRWHGRLIETSCTGPDHTPNRQVSNLTTVANLSVNNKGELQVKARKRGYAHNLEKGETILLFAKNAIYDFSQKDGVTNTSEKMRLRSTYDSSRLLETISRLSFQDEVLSLQVNYFTNGIYVQTLDFKLTR